MIYDYSLYKNVSAITPFALTINAPAYIWGTASIKGEINKKLIGRQLNACALLLSQLPIGNQTSHLQWQSSIDNDSAAKKPI